ncbi:MAG: PTS sugar transporter subunit IIB [Firmicutes bacterium HGW-Firmicutes-7]|nr:MAG: PTS sugar transporter subunit IIB [Firmicutes bacterium HGW-Firmicutes-7]
MVKIRLFCAAGMSTSVLVNKMRKVAEAKGIEVEIDAHPEGQMTKLLDGVDVALLGPQVGYTLSKAKKICGEKNIPIEIIPMMDYGMVNGEKVLDLALKLAGK